MSATALSEFLELTPQQLACKWRRERQFLVLSPTQAAYLAGMLDGEGSVMSNPAADAAKLYRRGSLLWTTIASTTGDALQQMREETGNVGRINRADRPPYKPIYRWHMTGRAAEWFLRSVIPYLKIKRRHAEIGLALRATIHGGNGRGRWAPTVAEMAERVRLTNELKELNRRGKGRDVQ